MRTLITPGTAANALSTAAKPVTGVRPSIFKRIGRIPSSRVS
jgi:hypothetical protein